jgi:hypothetical protein
MKDGTAHLAYKAEHVVDLASELLLAAELSPAFAADATTLPDSLVSARLNLQAADSRAVIEEAAADKGYHAAATHNLDRILGRLTGMGKPKAGRGVGGLGVLARKNETKLTASWGGLGRWIREVRPRTFFRNYPKTDLA